MVVKRAVSAAPGSTVASIMTSCSDRENDASASGFKVAYPVVDRVERVYSTVSCPESSVAELPTFTNSREKPTSADSKELCPVEITL